MILTMVGAKALYTTHSVPIYKESLDEILMYKGPLHLGTEGVNY